MELLPYPELLAELDHIIDPTARVPGSTACAAPVPSTDNNNPAESRTTVSRQRLDSKPFRVRPVYAKTGWMRRRLTLQERLLGRDVPGTIVKQAEAPVRECWANMLTMPYKIGVHALQSLRARDEVQAPRTKRKLSGDQAGGLGLLQLSTGEVTPIISSSEPALPLETKIDARMSFAVKAASADDAKVPTYLWNERLYKFVRPEVTEEKADQAFELLGMNSLLPKWRRQVRSFIT
jgi:hypothetical protein